jgi:NYN domain
VDRCALFVDAGYVLADGAMAVHGTRQRDSVSWDYAGLVKLLSGVSRDRTGLPILRCYWYEATVEGRRSAEHNALADLPGVKLRMGRMRPGRREGVEAEMHRDLSTLARNHAVSDVVIVSAEEDLAEVVVEVQDFGLRVVIVHIAADGNWTVSRPLREECDDIVEITAAHLRPFVDLIAGAEPADTDDQYANGSYQRRSISNGHGPALGAMTHQGLPAAALPAPPATYTGPVVEEYQRTAQPAGQGPLALSALAASAAAGPPPGAHHPPAAPAPPAPAQQAADPPVAPNSAAPENRTGPQPQAALPVRAVHVQAGSPDQAGANGMAGQPLAAPTLPPGYGAGPGDHVPAHGGYAFMPSQEAGGGRNAAAAAREPAPGRGDGVPDVSAQPAVPQDAMGQGPAPVQQPPVQQAPVHQASGPREAMPQNPITHNGLPQNTVHQNGLPQGPLPDSAMPQNHLQDLGHVGHNPVQASPAQPYPQELPPQVPDEARFAPGQRDYRAPDLPAQRGASRERDTLGTTPGPQVTRPTPPPAPYAENGSAGRFAENGNSARFAENGTGRFAENGSAGRFAENGNSGRFAENGDPGRFADNPLPGRFTDGPAPPRFPDGPPQARFAEGPGQSRFADSAAPARFGEGPGPSRFAESQGQPPYPPAQQPPAQQPPGQQPPAQHPSAPPGAFGAGSAAQVQYPQFNAAPPGQHAAHAARAADPAPGYQAPQRDQGPYSGPQPAAHAALPQPVAQPMAISLADAVQAAHAEGFGFGDAVARDAPALWLEAVLARKPRMPSDLEARLLQGSALPIDSLLHDEVRHSLRRGFWDALERSRR